MAGDVTPGAVCRIDPHTGEIRYSCGEVEASAIEETLCAVLFIHEVLRRNGRTPQPMDAAARSFIAGWESEAYRRKITAGTSDGSAGETGMSAGKAAKEPRVLAFDLGAYFGARGDGGPTGTGGSR